MHLIVIGDSEWCEVGYALDHQIMDMAMHCVNLNDLVIHIICNDPSSSMMEFIGKQNHIKLLSIKEAKVGMNQYQKAVVIHFGKSLSWLKAFPHYFVPISLPNKMTGISIIKRYFLNQKFKKWANSATKLISFNDWSLQSIIAHYPQLNNSILSLHLPLLKPPLIEWSEMSAAKDGLTKGNNYILIFAPVEKMTQILKEFSVFKKWQQSTMHLVFILENNQVIDKANSILKGYKFKQDVSIYNTKDINETWLAASYLTIFENASYSSGYFLMNSIQYGVPLLVDDQIQLPETWKSAGEVFSFAEKNALSNHFKLYYKDEVYRQSRATMGSNWLQMLNQNRSLFELFNNIVLSHIK
jgi:hypothetical protein